EAETPVPGGVEQVADRQEEDVLPAIAWQQQVDGIDRQEKEGELPGVEEHTRYVPSSGLLGMGIVQTRVTGAAEDPATSPGRKSRRFNGLMDCIALARFTHPLPAAGGTCASRRFNHAWGCSQGEPPARAE